MAISPGGSPISLARAERLPYDLRMFGMGIGELLVVLVIVLVLFGAGRLPEVMGSLGKGMQAFKRGLHEPPEIDVTPDDPAKAKKTESAS